MDDPTPVPQVGSGLSRRGLLGAGAGALAGVLMGTAGSEVLAEQLTMLSLTEPITNPLAAYPSRDWEHVYRDLYTACLLYTSDAADDLPSVDLGGPRVLKKKKK